MKRKDYFFLTYLKYHLPLLPKGIYPLPFTHFLNSVYWILPKWPGGSFSVSYPSNLHLYPPYLPAFMFYRLTGILTGPSSKPMIHFSLASWYQGYLLPLVCESCAISSSKLGYWALFPSLSPTTPSQLKGRVWTPEGSIWTPLGAYKPWHSQQTMRDPASNSCWDSKL